MNGQEKSQPRLSVERSSGSAAAASNGSTVPNGGASSGVNSTSWLKDMMANPLRAAQAGLISRPDDPSALLTGNFVYPYPAPFMFGNNPLSTLPRVGESISISSANLSTPAQVNQQRQQQQLLMQANIYGDIHSSQEKLPGSNSVKDASLKHPSSTVNMSSEILAKRSRTDCDNQPIHSHQMESVPMSTSSTSTLSTPNSSNRASIPHRPEYFRRGSIIQLGDNKLKRIEDLSTADFESSSQLNPDLCLDCSIVTKIIDEPLRGTAFLSFSIGEQCHDQVDATVEATVEHPFFVYNQGWSSVSPERTFNFYKLKCQQLRVGDRCISLTYKDNQAGPTSNTLTSMPSISSANASPKV